VESVQFERRAAQRFEFLLPVGVRLAGSASETFGLTQNLSVGGMLFYTEVPPAVGQTVEVTLVMPAEITLAGNMPVCCHGKVVRVIAPDVGASFGVAVRTGSFVFLVEGEAAVLPATLPRISGARETSGGRIPGGVDPSPG
jgi:PilZ domain